MSERLHKLHTEMGERGLDALALRCTANYTYAGATAECLVTPRETVPLTADAVRDLVASGATVGADDLAEELADLPLVDATETVEAARLCKTPAEIERIRRAHAINEAAMEGFGPEPGLHQDELTERFLARAFALGATANLVEPVWQVAARDEPLVFPTVGQARTFGAGDLVVVDTGLGFDGYASDYGRTWGARREHFDRWRDVMDAVLAVVRPGATGRDLVRAAGTRNGKRPWFDHLYLAHGTGTANAEMPLIGTDRGDPFDESIVLAAGMVFVLEPVIWDVGSGGYRAEETLVVTDTGYELLSERVTW